MTRWFLCLDLVASFAKESPGHASHRLIDKRGNPKFGSEAWSVGLRAYEQLKREDGSEVTTDDLEEFIATSHAPIDEFFEALNEGAKKGLILKDAKTDEPLDLPLRWRGCDWPDLIAQVFQAVAGLPADVRTECISRLEAHALVAVLCQLESAAILDELGDRDGAVKRVLEAAWLLEQVTFSDQIGAAAFTLAVERESQRASERAKRRHADDPRQEAKQFVKECWEAWRKNPGQYESAAEFARDMLDKFPGTLTSEPVICRWVRGWDRERK